MCAKTLSYSGERRLHSVYKGIKDRCYNPNSGSYKYYGARGICMCDLWLNSYDEFYDWAIENGYDEEAPRGECTIDRIDCNGNYEPNNCRWVDMKVQNANRRKHVHNSHYEVNIDLNETQHTIVKNIREHIYAYVENHNMTAHDFATLIGIGRSTLYSKLRGDTEYSMSEVIAAAKLIGCTIDDLIGTPYEIP